MTSLWRHRNIMMVHLAAFTSVLRRTSRATRRQVVINVVRRELEMKRKNSSLVLAIGALVVLLLVPQAQARPFTIKVGEFAVTKLGPLNTKSSRRYVPTIGKAVAAFGRPSNSFPSSSSSCVVKWRRLGLRIVFANFGDTRDTCLRDVGRAQSFTIERSRKWRTWHGLRIRMPEDRVLELHSGAEWFDGNRFYDEAFWLRSAVSPFGTGAEYPVLAAHLRHGDHGRVRSFAGWIGSAGE
jgi:hypothetical protein